MKYSIFIAYYAYCCFIAFGAYHVIFILDKSAWWALGAALAMSISPTFKTTSEDE